MITNENGDLILATTRGNQGLQGLQGAQGAQGAQGLQGAQGAQGELQGAQGAQGAQGHQGNQGTAGTPISDISCKATGSQGINTGSTTTLSMTTEVYDTDTMHSNSTNPQRITCTTAGKYLVTAICRFESNSTGVRTLSVGGVGANITASRTVNASSIMNSYVQLQFEDSRAAGEYFQMTALQNSGTTLTAAFQMSVQRLGA